MRGRGNEREGKDRALCSEREGKGRWGKRGRGNKRDILLFLKYL